jgi:hypothetical protein
MVVETVRPGLVVYTGTPERRFIQLNRKGAKTPKDPGIRSGGGCCCRGQAEGAAQRGLG